MFEKAKPIFNRVAIKIGSNVITNADGSLDTARTLYWNPAVTTDETGHAKIEFYNNSRSRNFSISAETVTPDGMIGINKNE